MISHKNSGHILYKYIYLCIIKSERGSINVSLIHVHVHVSHALRQAREDDYDKNGSLYK